MKSHLQLLRFLLCLSPRLPRLRRPLPTTPTQRPAVRQYLRSLACLITLSLAPIQPGVAQTAASGTVNSAATESPANSTDPADPADANTSDADATGPEDQAASATQPYVTDVARRLGEIDRLLAQREKELETFTASIATIPAEKLNSTQQAQLERAQAAVSKLQTSFEQIALGGLTSEALTPDPEKNYDWQAELMEVVRPVLASLKDLTDKPRRIEAVRQRIAKFDKQIKTTDEALAALDRLLASVVNLDVRSKLNTLAESWHERKTVIDDQRDVARFQLGALLEDNRSNIEVVEQTVREFVHGRGLTLAIAALAAIAAWLIVRVIVWLMRRLRRKTTRKTQRRRERAIHYTSRLITGLLMLLAVLIAFYVRSDVFLLAIMILAIASLIIGLRHLIPRFYDEIRLLLDFGAVRDSERLIYDGLPMQVKEMSNHAILINPALKGFVRLPLGALASMVSRPPTNEPWFPSSSGDFVKFDDGSVAQVVDQTVDTVVLRQVGSLRNMRSADFFASAPTNLSLDGFVVATSFGVGYRHQAICLTEIPEKMQQALESAIAQAEWAEFCKGVSVELKEAASSSLDYHILLRFDGEGASAYFAVPRMVQRVLVGLCNENDWEIPFAQLTVHKAELS